MDEPANRIPGSLQCPNPAPESDAFVDVYQLAEAAQEVQEQIVALLLDEYERGEHGCLSENGYNCDWSQELFAEHYMGQFAKEREQAFQYCVLMTGGNTLDHPDPLFNMRDDDGSVPTMSTFPDKLEAVQDELRAQLDGLPYRKVGNLARVGETLSGGKDLGDPKWFGASYEYSADWSIEPRFADNATANTTACAFAGQAKATFDAGISILGQDVPVIHAMGDGQAHDGTGSYSFGMEFLGQSFLPTSDSARFHHVESGSLETNRASATVVVVVVPVTFQAYGEMEYGYEVEAEMSSNNECGSQNPSPELGLSLRLEPFAKVNAVASAAVGVSGAQAGVRGRVAMLNANLPVRSSLMVREHPDYGTIQLHPEASADLEVGTLSGRMSAFAEVGVSLAKYKAEKEIYSWRGLHETIPIWLLDSDPVQLAAFSWGAWQDWKQVNISHSNE